MSDHPNAVQEVRELWNGFIEDKLDEQQSQRFDVLMKSSRQARLEYIGLMNMHCTLSRYLSPAAVSDDAFSDNENAAGVESLCDIDLAEALALEDNKTTEKQEKTEEAKGDLIFDFLQSIPGYFSNNTFQVFVLLFLLLPSVFAFLTVLNSSKNGAGTDLAPLVANAMLTEWSEEAGAEVAVGSQLVQGKQYTLLSGFVELMFFNDARVIIHGPATFAATSYNEVDLESGRCVAHVPPMASGFTVNANGSKVVDLGTEFGVETNGDMETEVYVFQGKVELGIKDAPLDSKIQLTASEGVRSSGKTGVITPAEIDTDRFIRTLNANGVLGALPVRNASFEEPRLAGQNWTQPDGTLCSVPISYWRVSASGEGHGDLRKNAPAHLQNPDIGYYLWSSQHGMKSRSGVTDGEQACVLKLRDGTIAGTKPSKDVWVYYSLGRIRPQDVGHSLKLSADCFARTPRAEGDAKITLAFATKTSDQSCGTFVGKGRTVTGSAIWGRSEKLKASFVMPIELVGRELFIVFRVEDDSPGSGEDLYLIDNVEMEHYHP